MISQVNTLRKSKISQKVAQYIDRNSPLFRLYTRTPTLKEVLKIPNIDQVIPIDFSEALRALMDTTGLSYEHIGAIGGIGSITVLHHIIYRSGPSKNGVKIYANTRIPPTTPRVLLNIARELTDSDLDQLISKRIIANDATNTGGRISFAFYDAQTGLLVFRACDGPSNGPNSNRVVRLEEAKKYLMEPQNEDAEQKLEYLSGILSDRFDVLTRDGGFFKKSDGTNLRREEVELKIRSKLKITLEKAANFLGLIPIYLTFPPDPEEVRDSDSTLLYHMDIQSASTDNLKTRLNLTYKTARDEKSLQQLLR